MSLSSRNREKAGRNITLGDLELSPNPNVISEGKRARKGRQGIEDETGEDV